MVRSIVEFQDIGPMPWRVTIKVNSVGRSYVGHRTESAVADV